MHKTALLDDASVTPFPNSGYLFSAQQVSAIESLYSKFHSKPTFQLMEKAALSIFETLTIYWPKATQILVVCGKGNNAGDGFLLAQLALESGLNVDLMMLNDPAKLKGDAALAWHNLQRLKPNQVSNVDFNDYHVIIDAILGSGIKGAVREPFDAVISQINQSKTPVLAIDLPSGVNANSGAVENIAIYANITVTMIGIKRGLVTAQAPDYSGKILLASLGINEPENWLCSAQSESPAQLITLAKFPSVRALLKKRRKASHKGTHGHCLILAGAKGMLGAAIIASRGCARSGAGLVSCWVEQNAEMVVLSQPEIMAKDLPLPDIDSVGGQLSKFNCVVLGPGLGTEDWAQSLLRRLSEDTNFLQKSKLYDADALNWLALNPSYDERRVLTPHPAEAARLLGCQVADVEQDRFLACVKIAQQYGGICLLKGAGTIIADSTGQLCCCPVGNPGMASGGMGDLLSGIIGGLLAQGYKPWDAVKIGVCVHAEAADLAATEDLRYQGLLATDLLQYLPKLLN
ncbi:NAD(P)H-hydrate dehydratase [Aliikangiella sp. IMCC44653]